MRFCSVGMSKIKLNSSLGFWEAGDGWRLILEVEGIFRSCRSDGGEYWRLPGLWVCWVRQYLGKIPTEHGKCASVLVC